MCEYAPNLLALNHPVNELAMESKYSKNAVDETGGFYSGASTKKNIFCLESSELPFKLTLFSLHLYLVLMSNFLP